MEDEGTAQVVLLSISTKKQKETEGNGVPGDAGELIELASGGEDEESDLSVAEEPKLVGLLEEAAPPLGETHLAAGAVLDPAQLHLPSRSHLLLSEPYRSRQAILEGRGKLQPSNGSGASKRRSMSIG